jgi:predicted transcriptional regulator
MKRLDARHYQALEMLLTGQYTNKEVAEAVGISERQFYRWLEEPMFKKAFNNMVVSYGKGRLTAVLDSMYDAAIHDKNAAAAKIVLEAHKILGKGEEVNVNVETKSIDINELKRQLKEMQQGE